MSTRLQNHVLGDAIHAIYQDILYFENVIRVQGPSINVVVFMAVRKEQRLLRLFSRNLSKLSTFL
jgi:hypothetical protein